MNRCCGPGSELICTILESRIRIRIRVKSRIRIPIMVESKIRIRIKKNSAVVEAKNEAVMEGRERSQWGREAQN
jgi:hypothetical protein